MEMRQERARTNVPTPFVHRSIDRYLLPNAYTLQSRPLFFKSEFISSGKNSVRPKLLIVLPVNFSLFFFFFFEESKVIARSCYLLYEENCPTDGIWKNCSPLIYISDSHRTARFLECVATVRHFSKRKLFIFFTFLSFESKR